MAQFSFVMDDLFGKDATQNTQQFMKNISQFVNKIAPIEEKQLPCDIVADNYYVTFYIDIPGCEKQDVQVDIVDENSILVMATRSFQRNNLDIIQQERYDGTVQRQIKLPDGLDTSSICAKYNNGVLSVSFKKIKSNTSSRSVPIM